MVEQEASFQQLMQDGHSASWDQNWEQAAEYYRKALMIHPKHPQALTSCGLALLELGDLDKALQCYLRAAEAEPEDALPLEKIAQIYARMGNFRQSIAVSMSAADLYLKQKDAAKAIENWEHVTKLDPDNIPARSRLALVHERLGNSSQAISEYLSIASLLQKQGNPNKARQTIDRALKLSPDSAEAQRYLNLLKDFKPLPQPAVSPDNASFETVRREKKSVLEDKTKQKLDPVSQACQDALTLLAGRLFEVDEESGLQTAPKGLRKLVSTTPGKFFKSKDLSRIRQHLTHAIELQTRGQVEKALNEWQLAMDSGLDHVAAFYNLGYLYARCDRPQEAIRCLEISAKDADFALGSRLLLGELLLKQYKLSEAFQDYLQALKVADVSGAPRDQAAGLARQYDHMIATYRQNNNSAVQEKFCANIKALLFQPDWPVLLAQVRQQQPEYRPDMPLEPLIEMLVVANSSQVVVSVSAINEMIEKGQLNTAMEEALYTISLAPTYLPLHSLIGELMVKRGDLERAVSKFQVVSRAYAVRNELDQALQYSRRVVELDPTNLEARKKLIDQLKTSGETKQAIEETVRLAEAQYKLADLNTARGTYLTAIQMEQQTNANPSSQAHLLHRVVDIDMQNLDWRQALNDLEQIMRLSPGDQKALTEVVRLRLRFGQEQQAMSAVDDYAAFLASKNNLARLAPFLVGLLEEHPDLIPLRRRLVDAYVNLGKTQEAVAQLDLIGETMLQSGDRTGAIQTIEKIISLSPPNKAEYLVLLNQLRSGSG